MEFILSCENIVIDVNLQDCENKDITALQSLIYNANFDIYIKVRLIKILLKRRYKITEKDRVLLKAMLKQNQDEFLIIELSNVLYNRELVDVLYIHSKLFLIIESIRKNKIIGFNFSNWISFANNAISHYQNHWRYIELALKKWGIWDKLIAEDKKGTFQKKLQELYSNRPEQEHDVDDIFQDLYPELMYSND